MATRDIPWETLSRQAAADFGVPVPFRPSDQRWLIEYTLNGKRRQRYYTGEMDDLLKWLDGLFLPFVEINKL